MSSPLVQHAIENVWCAPYQDHQHHIILHRITPDGGVLSQFPLLWDELKIPKTEKRTYFHFYQIGNLPSKVFDFVKKENRWVNVVELNNINNILVDCYMASGAVIPRDRIWVSTIYNDNIVVAIALDFKTDFGINNRNTRVDGSRYNEKFTLDNSTVIIRFYSNAYFESEKYQLSAQSRKLPIRYLHKRIKTQKDYNDFIRECREIENEFNGAGGAVYYADGFIINKPVQWSDFFLNKTLWFYYDESFKQIVDFNIRHCPAFISELNRGVRKYLLLMDDVYDVMDYHDDVDFYIVNKVTGKGIYYNRNARFGVTQITHNAYAINAEIVKTYIDTHDFLKNLDECVIRVCVRQGGRNHGLINQKNRIQEMYRLGYVGILEALINTPSNLPEWRAASLEKSDYMQLVNAHTSLLNKDTVVKAYGYNAISQVFTNPIRKVTNRVFDASYVSRIADRYNNERTQSYFAYDNRGYFLGWENCLGYNKEVRIIDEFADEAEFVEVFNYKMNTEGLLIYGNTDVQNSNLDQYGFRCYVANKSMSGEYSNFTDVTGSKFYKHIPKEYGSSSKIEWNWNLLSQADLFPFVVCDKNMFIFTVNKKETDKYDGTIAFDIQGTWYWNKDKVKDVIPIPTGHIEVFFNGMSLIRDVDYYIEWPRVVITNYVCNFNREYKIVVRCHGYCNPETMQPWAPRETGFIKDGKVSINGKYDVRKNKNIRVVVDNVMKHLDTVNYGEELLGAKEADGRPYSVTDYVLPIENLVDGYDTVSLYQETLEIDDKVSDYLTPRLPERESVNEHVLHTRVTVISPVISKLLHLFETNYDLSKQLPANYDNTDVRNVMKPFLWLLEFDPAYRNVDENYFRIEPHAKITNFVITKEQYKFLEWVNELFLNNRVDLSIRVLIEDGE